MASNMTTMPEALPPLPAYEVTKMPDLIPGIDDFWLSLAAPIIGYWVVSAFFHIIDVYDVWPQYRLHTPAEIASRNRASRYEVLRDVILQQIIQTIAGYALGYLDPPQETGMEDYQVAVWATRIRLAQRALPTLLSLMGINAVSVAKNMAASHPLLAGALSGGYYPFLTTGFAGPDGSAVPAFAHWELLVAKAIYWGIIPGIQFLIAVTFVDTWQYFLHRYMHTNKWMYST
jgi:sphinganine C4-monooxygenase